MKRKSIFALLVSLAAIAAMVLGSSANAGALDDVIACQFDGITSDLTDIKNPPDLNGHGTYNFASINPAQCVHVDVDGQLGTDPDDDTGVWTGTITSTGSYQNIVCGTGHAHGHPWLDDAAAGNHHDPAQNGHAPITHPSVSTLTATTAVAGGAAPDNDSPVSGIRYEIDFASGQGALTFQAASDAHPAGGSSLAAPGGGFVSIDPIPRPGFGGQPVTNPTTGCVNTPVVDFTVAGAFTAAVGS